MGSFIIDSIGFSKTQAMVAILRDQPNFYVTHGSNNFKEGGMIGADNLSVADFVSQMLEAEKAHEHCVASHCIFNPVTTKQEAMKNNVTFMGYAERIPTSRHLVASTGQRRMS